MGGWVGGRTNLGGVEDDRREAGRHLTVESNLDPSLDFVLALDEKVEHFLYWWVGGWVGELLYIARMVEEEEAVEMRCCGLLGGGWVGR